MQSRVLFFFYVQVLSSKFLVRVHCSNSFPNESEHLNALCPKGSGALALGPSFGAKTGAVEIPIKHFVEQLYFNTTFCSWSYQLG